MASTSLVDAAEELARCFETDYVKMYQYAKTPELRRELTKLKVDEDRAKVRASALARRLRKAMVKAKSAYVNSGKIDPISFLVKFITPGIEAAIANFEETVHKLSADYHTIRAKIFGQHKATQKTCVIVGGVAAGAATVGIGLLVLHCINAITCVVLPPLGLCLLGVGIGVAVGVAIGAGIAALVDKTDYEHLEEATKTFQARVHELCKRHRQLLEQIDEAVDDEHVATADNKTVTDPACSHCGQRAPTTEETPSPKTEKEAAVEAACAAFRAQLKQHGTELTDFECPIMHDTLKKPWATPNGRLYSYVALEHWVNKNHSDPMTRQPLTMDQCKPADSVTVGMIRQYELTQAQLEASEAELKMLRAPDDETLQEEAKTALKTAKEKGLAFFDSILAQLQVPAGVEPTADELNRQAKQIRENLREIPDVKLGRLYRGESVNSPHKFGDLISGGKYRRCLKRHAKALEKKAAALEASGQTQGVR